MEALILGLHKNIHKYLNIRYQEKLLIFSFLSSIVIDSLDPADYKAYCGAFK